MLPQLGNYEVKEEIGRGSMGVVYRGWSPSLSRDVALKTMLPPLVSSGANFVKKFAREARVAAGLNHPNIVTIYEVNESDPQNPFIVMEFLKGHDLKTLINTKAPIPLVRKLEICLQVCRGLQHAHEKSVVHRDFKPENVFVGDDGQVKVLDFGLAQIAKDSTLSQSGTMVGTLRYMTPEHFIDPRTVDAQSDQFSMAIVFYEFLTGTHPFPATTYENMMYRILSGDPPRPPSQLITESCPPQIDGVFEKAFQRKKTLRFRTVADFSTRLEGVAALLRSEMANRHVTEGKLALYEKRYFEAMECFQKAMDLDPSNLDIVPLQDEAETLWQIRVLTDSAEKEIAGENHELAEELLSQILQLDPTHEWARRNHDTLVSRKKKIEDGLEQAQDLMDADNYRGARACLEEVRSVDPHRAALISMMSSVKTRLDEIERHVERAQQACQERRLPEARSAVQQIQKLDPSTPELVGLLQGLDRLEREALRLKQDAEQQLHSNRLRNHVKKISEALENRRFDEAVVIAEDTEFANTIPVSAVRREALVLRALHRAEALANSRRFSDAVVILKAALAEIEDPRLVELLKTIQETQEELERQWRERQQYRIQEEAKKAAVAEKERNERTAKEAAAQKAREEAAREAARRSWEEAAKDSVALEAREAAARAAAAHLPPPISRGAEVSTSTSRSVLQGVGGLLLGILALPTLVLRRWQGRGEPAAPKDIALPPPANEERGSRDHSRSKAKKGPPKVPTEQLDHGSFSATPPGAMRPGESVQLDENVQFTVYRPAVVQVGKWYTLLAFAHLSERRPGTSSSEPDPLEQVTRQAAAVLAEDTERYRRVSEDSTRAVPQEAELTFVPEIPGVEFNPPRRTFLWQESVHREEFRMQAGLVLQGQVARGRLTVFHGSIIIGDVPLSIRVGGAEVERQVSATVSPYRRIFASYSHRDVAIVEECEQFARSVGDKYLRDMLDLSAGEVWDERLRQMIQDADVFQLFWSWNAMRSGFVRQEWEHALSLANKGPAFIRPVYWEEPLPKDRAQGLPPEGLKRLHFQLLPRRSMWRRFLLVAGGVTWLVLSAVFVMTEMSWWQRTPWGPVAARSASVLAGSSALAFFVALLRVVSRKRAGSW